MMRGIIAFIFILSLSGCVAAFEDSFGGGRTAFPQYSGVYRLKSISEDSLKPGIPRKQPPQKLRVVHRMEWNSNYWNHRLLFQAVHPGSNEATGGFSGDLDEMTYVGFGCLGTKGMCDFSGAPFLTRSKTSVSSQSAGAFCNFYGYEYRVEMVAGDMVPDPELLNKIYLDYEEDKNFGYRLQLTDPSKATIHDESRNQWNSQISNNHGYRLVFRLSKQSNTSYFGCKDGFPVDDNDTDLGSMTLMYEMDQKDSNGFSDLRTAPASEAKSVSGGNIFDQITVFQ